MAKRVNRLIILMITIVSILLLASVKESFSYWLSGIRGSETIVNANIGLGDYIEREENYLDRLPANTPQYVIDRLNELSLNNDDIIMSYLVDEIIKLVLYPGFNDIFHIGCHVEDLFDKTPTPSFKAGDVIIYLDVVDGVITTQLISVIRDYQVSSWGINHFMQELNSSWGAIKLISSTYQEGILYLRINAPILYNGEYYYVRWNTIEVPSNSEAWYKISIDYSEESIYHYGQIVRKDNRYFIHRGSHNSGNDPTGNGSWAWNEIEVWNATTTYSWSRPNNINDAGFRDPTRYRVVRLLVNNQWHFYKLLSASSINQRPSEDTLRSGIWQEISNAWIGPSGNFVHSYYFYNNTYLPGDIIVYGTNPKHRYSYWEAIREVPYGVSPFTINSSGYYTVNDVYWRYVSD